MGEGLLYGRRGILKKVIGSSARRDVNVRSTNQGLGSRCEESVRLYRAQVSTETAAHVHSTKRKGKSSTVRDVKVSWGTHLKSSKFC